MNQIGIELLTIKLISITSYSFLTRPEANFSKSSFASSLALFWDTGNEFSVSLDCLEPLTNPGPVVVKVHQSLEKISYDFLLILLYSKIISKENGNANYVLIFLQIIINKKSIPYRVVTAIVLTFLLIKKNVTSRKHLRNKNLLIEKK